MGRIMVSLLLTVCACVFSSLNTEAKPAPCLPICPDDPCVCGRNRGANYMNWWTRPTPQLPQYGNYGPQLPQYGNYGPQLPQYGNYGACGEVTRQQDHQNGIKDGGAMDQGPIYRLASRIMQQDKIYGRYYTIWQDNFANIC